VRKRKEIQKGFTLIELLIVVAIIAILAAIAVPNFLEAQVRAKITRVRSDHRSLGVALEAYRVDGNEYPPNIGSIDDPRRLILLSTPVAYITTPWLKDPFKLMGPGANIRTTLPAWAGGNRDVFLCYIYIPFWIPPGATDWGDNVDNKFWDLNRARNYTGGVPGVPFPYVYGHDLGGVTGDARKFPGPFHWVLVGYGPDFSIQFDDPNSGNPGGLDAYLPYDPTNGTVSAGDIFRFSGVG